MTEPGRSLSIERYDAAAKILWDDFVRASKNGTFLFLRDYMDYHADRFDDHSLFVKRDGVPIALLPANRAGNELHTHKGLTYGGLVVSERMTTLQMLDLFETLLEALRQVGVHRMHYKTIPSIYHRLPAEEDRFALFRSGARLTRRDVMSVIPAGRRGPVQARRRRGATKAASLGVIIREAGGWAPFWAMLTDHLRERYGADPVHTYTEIDRLRSRFKDEIRLFEGVFEGDVVAGVVIFESALVARTQYLASSPRGREVGALDAIVCHLIEDVFASKPFIDFGSSNGEQGRGLNEGLIDQKEGFGARTVVQDFYELDL